MDRKQTWIYCRVAHSGPDSEELLTGQRLRLEAYAKEHGFEIIGSSNDIGNGLTLDRPGLQKFMDAVEDESVNVLLLTEISRLGRDMNKVVQFWQLLHGHGVHVFTDMDGEIDLILIFNKNKIGSKSEQ